MIVVEFPDEATARAALGAVKFEIEVDNLRGADTSILGVAYAAIEEALA